MTWNSIVRDAGSGSLSGADGVKDGTIHGKYCVATGWETGTQARLLVYESDGSCNAVKVGDVTNCEDACIAEIDGEPCVITASEGGSAGRRVIIHWAPADVADLLDTAEWSSTEINASTGLELYMQVEPIEFGGKTGIAWGSKTQASPAFTGKIGRFEYGTDPHDPDDWTKVDLLASGATSWVMGFIVHYDWNSGEPAIVWGNRGAGGGSAPGPQTLAYNGSSWTHYEIHDFDGTISGSAMFIQRILFPGDSRKSLVVACRRSTERIYVFDEPATYSSVPWSAKSGFPLTLPDASLCGDIKDAQVIEFDGSNRPVFICTFEAATASLYGITRVYHNGSAYVTEDLYGTSGTKFDKIVFRIPPGKTAKNVLTTEETDNIGVIELINPANETGNRRRRVLLGGAA